MTKIAELIDTGILTTQIIRETDKAVQVRVFSGVTQFGGEREVWLPKSAIKWEAFGGFHPTLRAPVWLCRKHGLMAR